MGLGVTSTAGSPESWPPRSGPGGPRKTTRTSGQAPWDWLRRWGLSTQTPFRATDRTPPDGWVLGRLVRLRWVLPAGDRDRVAFEPGVSLQASCLSERSGSGSQPGRIRVLPSLPPPGSPPQAPRPALGPSGMQAPWLWGAAWRLASCYKRLWCRLPAAAQEPCGCERAAPGGLSQPPTGPAAGPLQPLCPVPPGQRPSW